MDEKITASLIDTLEQQGLQVLSQEGKHLRLSYEYTIEIENEHLFKLLHEGFVVAPFDNVQELYEFIKMDIALNGYEKN